jgi:hypothetical protein
MRWALQQQQQHLQDKAAMQQSQREAAHQQQLEQQFRPLQQQLQLQLCPRQQLGMAACHPLLLLPQSLMTWVVGLQLGGREQGWRLGLRQLQQQQQQQS